MLEFFNFIIDTGTNRLEWKKVFLPATQLKRKILIITYSSYSIALTAIIFESGPMTVLP